MMKIFITGSADGLGLLAAQKLAADGHEVILHARNPVRGDKALRHVAGAKDVLIADLSNIGETKALAEKANSLGAFDAVIHNAGVYQTDSTTLLHVNILAPYILTALMDRPKRLIYLSSGMHVSGRGQWTDRPSYSDTKLQVLMLAKVLARKWPNVFANAVDPGWVPTKMGGKGAPDDLEKGYGTQIWLATSDDDHVKVSGHYFFHQKIARHNAAGDDLQNQDGLIDNCERLTGVNLD